MSDTKIPSAQELRIEAEAYGLSGDEAGKFVLSQQAYYRDERAKDRAERAEMRAHEINVLQLRQDIPAPQFSPMSVPKLPPYRDDEDISAYLIRFERIAQLLQIDQNSYAVYLGSLLSGKALQIYSSLSEDITSDYNSLKAALLAGFNKNRETYREEFRNARIGSSDTYSQFAVRLDRLFELWVNSHNSFNKDYDSLKDFMLVDQFMSACNPALRIYLKEHNPVNLEAMVKLSDNWQCAHKSSRDKLPIKVKGPFNNTENKSFSSARDFSKIKCFNCGELGHTKNRCPKQLRSFQELKRNDNYRVNFSLDERTSHKYMYCGTLNGSPVSTILRDTGCSCVIVSEELLPESDITNCETVTLTDYLGRENEFPKVKCYLRCPLFTGWVKAVRAPIKMCSILLGNVAGVVDSPGSELKPEVSAVETRSSVKNKTLHPLVVPTLNPINIDPEQFRELQKTCSSLFRVRDLAESGTEQNTKDGIYRFVYYNNLLYRECIKSSNFNFKDKKFLVVPSDCRKFVLSLAHESPVAGHFGHRKTILRVKRDFFWPGMTSDIKNYCRSCDKCQRFTPKGNVAKAPLEPMPIITEPFTRVAIDIVGPLSPSSSGGHRYILTLIDFATGYPEAIPLRETTSIAVAEALLEIFSRVGIPREILSDNGAQFTSQLMGEVHKLLGVKPLFSSVYHPMGNGRIERLHSTLKSCLKKLCSTKPRDWHRYLIPTLFALREIPSDRSGFSPFELLYGRQCRGPLAVLRELWEDETLTPDNRTLFQYVLELQDKLQECAKLASENSEISVAKYKTYFDLKSQERKLEIGDEVLVLLPDSNNKLLIAWKGPFPVIEKRGKLNYVIDDNGNSKLFHINLLKKYHRRACVGSAEIADSTEESFRSFVGNVNIAFHASIISDEKFCESNPCEIFTPEIGESYSSYSIGDNLSAERKLEVDRLMKTYSDVMNDRPGCTSSYIHDINLLTTKPIRAKHYPIPLHLKSEFDIEVEKLLNLGIIQPSNSSYSSPPVLVAKSDNTYRLAIDYRALNSVTIFDAEPPCIAEEELDKFHDALYFSEFDITKAYYQIKLAVNARKYTAFPTSKGLMEFVRMPFGLVTAVASYIKLMRIVLSDLSNVCFYFDNIFIYSKDWTTHVSTIERVLIRLREHGLTAKPSKCNFGFNNINYLGFNVGNGFLRTLSEKVKILLDFPPPKTKKLLKSFLGMFSFYRKFVPDPATLAAPLNELLHKTVKEPLQWSEQVMASFEQIKSVLANDPVLKLPDPSKTFVLRTDASSVGLGSVLMQFHGDIAHPVAYAGRTLLPAERNYSVIERECLGIVWAVNKFKYYLIGKPFVLEVDHKPLVYLNKFRGDNARLMRWALALQPYRFTLVHIPGAENVGADLLSRF